MIAHAAAAVALVLAQAMAGQTPTAPPCPCVTPAEAGAMAAVVLPEFLASFGRECSRHLPEDAFLRARGAELVERWRGEAAAQRETALAGMVRMSRDVRAGASGEAQPMATPAQTQERLGAMVSGLTGGISKDLTPATCLEVSRFAEAVAPLPVANVAQMVSAVMGFGVRVAPPEGDDGPPICPP